MPECLLSGSTGDVLYVTDGTATTVVAIHLQHCKKKRAKRIAREERRRAQTPLPSPDRFTLHSTPDSTPIPRSPTREPSLTEDAQADPEDIFRELSLLDEAPEGDENPGKSGAVLPPC